MRTLQETKEGGVAGIEAEGKEWELRVLGRGQIRLGEGGSYFRLLYSV